ncbi:MAG: isochorismatase family protein [candidate division Zixibacteria bacterium]|nr:isochorismatase family protein [candidate division Zixibacteria bacterium]
MINRDDAYFILVDVQGKLANLMYKKYRLFKNLKILIAGLRKLDIPIIWSEQYPEGLGETVPEIKAALDGLEPASKKTFSVCRNPELMRQIESTGRTEAIVAGIESHVCVYQTVADLLEKGHKVSIVGDAISSRTKDNKEIGLQKMLDTGAKITSVEMILFELLEVAEGDTFKEISRLVK